MITQKDYDNSLDEFYFGHCMINVNVAAFTTIQTVRSYNYMYALHMIRVVFFKDRVWHNHKFKLLENR